MEKNLPGAAGVLDFDHAAEHLHAAAPARGSDAVAARAWYRARRRTLIESGAAGLLEELAARGEAVPELADYFGPHVGHTPYRERLVEGRSIGSGMVEGACQTAIGKRLKQTEARWRIRRLERMAALCCLVDSNLFEAYWRQAAAERPDSVTAPRVRGNRRAIWPPRKTAFMIAGPPCGEGRRALRGPRRAHRRSGRPDPTETSPAMPILPAEPELFPTDLFDRPAREVASADPTASDDLNGDEDDPPKWWCLHTKPRQEKATARFLRDRRLAHYLPQISKESRTPAGRKIRSVVPLFPSYLFLLAGDRQRIESYKGGQLVAVLDVDDQDQIEVELSQIHRMLSSGLPVVAEPEYPLGSRVRILSGPLMGMVGTVVRRGNQDHFVAIVHFLGRGAAVELESWQVEPADE